MLCVLYKEKRITPILSIAIVLPLKAYLSGFLFRRIDDASRLVYWVDDI
ncbi:MAG: type II toxin-antitoxin system YoeB family toxin [Pseudomonadales bacterium]|nr:type II toxin-antitoxin system YoeB family toxin [Pseudomonadales bacterium]